MKRFEKLLLPIAIIMIFSSCRMQEKMLFYPEKLPKDHVFSFNEGHKEYFVKVDKNVFLNGVLFKADSSKGLVFYLHGNAGSIAQWGMIANTYLDNGYDFFVLDYRGYGKSGGEIRSEKQMHKDIQIVYDSLKTQYDENKIIIVGYSIGTGFAAKLASTNKPKLLVLKAPYYSMVDLAHHYLKYLPSFLIRYKIRTNRFITKIQCPVIVFHGDRDEVIYYGSSEKLQKHFKKDDRLIKLRGQSHNGINENYMYLNELKKILE